MSKYLQKYVGTYRVKAEYDLDTNDFPRLEDGSLDPSFDDLYIVCKNGVKIIHGVGNVLWCHIPTRSRGMNILRAIYVDKVSDKLPEEDTSDEKKYLENLCSKLVEKGVLVSAEVLDYEVCFEFKSSMFDYIAKLVGASSYGARISPFSPKNLPREPYKIPEKDMKLYRESIKNFPTHHTTTRNGESIEIVDGIFIKKLNEKFDKVVKKSQPKGFDVNKDRKLKCLKGKEYIHSFGSEMWNKYCEFLKENSNGESD